MTLSWPLGTDQSADGTGVPVGVPSRSLLGFSFPFPLARESRLSLFLFSSRTIDPDFRLLKCPVYHMWEIKKKTHGTTCIVIPQILKSKVSGFLFIF